MMPKKEEKPNEARKKDELFWQILDAAIRLECTKGHLRWKMTDLSRASGVTRSLIYYYFGNSKTAIVRAAIQVVGEEFYGLDPSRHQLWEQGRMEESISMTRDLFKKTPYIGVFYLTQRRKGSVFYDEIMDLERRYLDRLGRLIPGAPKEVLQLLFASLFGLVVLDDIPNSSIKGLAKIFSE